MSLSITKLSIECHYAECRISITVIPNVVMLSVVMLNAVAPVISFITNEWVE